MNKFLIFSALILILSCARENFSTSLLKVNLPLSNKSVIPYNYWINIYNPETNYFISKWINTDQTSFEIALPNNDGYIIYGYKVALKDINNQNIFATEKAFYQSIDLSNGGIKTIDATLSSDAFLNNPFINKDFIVDNEKTIPMSIMFRFCSADLDRLDKSDCSLEPTMSPYNEGPIQSVKIRFFQNNRIESRFSDSLMIKESPCLSKVQTQSYIDSKMKLPIYNNNNQESRLPTFIQISLYFDVSCEYKIDDYRSEFGVIETDDIKISTDTITSQLAMKKEVTSVIIKYDKQDIGEKCIQNYNCDSDKCELNECKSQ
jgi:hypothetical protein